MLFRSILGIKSKVIIKKNEDSVQNVVKLNKEKIKEEDKERENIMTENGEGLQHLKNVQPNFNEADFLSGAEKALPMILEAKYTANKKVLISFLEDDIFRIFEKQILDQESKGHSIKNCEINVSERQIQRLNLELQSLDEEITRIQDEIESIKKSIQTLDDDITREKGIIIDANSNEKRLKEEKVKT